MMTGSHRYELSDESASQSPESLFERCHWLYALCREYFFRDHTREITSALFPSGNPANGTKLLELGCGPGLYACRFAKDFPQVTATGIDLSKRLIRRARARAANLQLQNCTFLVGDAQALSQLAHSVDAVIVSRLFLIVPDREAVLTEIFRVLRPGGRCFIAEPTSGIVSRLPLSAMWVLARMTASPWEKFREPQQVEVMRPGEFLKLVQGLPWASVDVRRDDWYQYAVCEKSEARINEQSWSAA
ncbi:class I SAM-dependent methyltransferase [Terriglobus saanensis]|uniref:Methyltransferase type 11 n=1 Tax=Terriglobus saanensis (strain ATCC BAA-1853 / DSM 23119 / SP1PR4) TaxID=401053 RepID=E8V0J7_TERSS|nr:class I SAM-dependent methyltransferase [Terriglobus saanensis]ADV84480.1 Methyltransferase type 11 [Terriglobus saanensis SP1PR4]